MLRWELLGMWGLVLTASACGGEAVVDQGGGGSGGTTTSSTTGSTSSGTTSTTTTGTTTTSTTTGGPCSCPLETPAPGMPCDCPDGTECEFDECAAGGAVSLYACYGGAWQLTGQMTCPAVVCPNGVPCGFGEVCLITTWGFEAIFECVPNPCTPTPLTCGCASVVCEPGTVCTSAGGGNIYCDCPNC